MIILCDTQLTLRLPAVSRLQIGLWWLAAAALHPRERIRKAISVWVRDILQRSEELSSFEDTSYRCFCVSHEDVSKEQTPGYISVEDCWDVVAFLVYFDWLVSISLKVTAAIMFDILLLWWGLHLYISLLLHWNDVSETIVGTMFLDLM